MKHKISQYVFRTHNESIAWPAHGHKSKIYIYDKVILPLCMQYGATLGASLMDQYAAADILWNEVYSPQYSFGMNRKGYTFL
jgi:hypothetical protein